MLCCAPLSALLCCALQIPDLDAVFQTSDFPCIKRKWQHGAAGPTPMFGYQASVRHYDLPLPDHAFWGHEYQYLQVGDSPLPGSPCFQGQYI